jgi:hypothetical protein
VGEDFTIRDVDYAAKDLPDQTPFAASLVRRMPGPDRPDYWLAKLAKPLVWEQPTGARRQIEHLIVASRYQGTTVSETMADLPVGIAYVIDESLLDDELLDFSKCHYVAIGTATSSGTEEED